ncbi:MAG: radical SAM family heme chaperone HemW [Clostridiales bacterium]|nr:radical SAM family heme chaperone HemW [Clostridiales bacterium]
MSAGLYVHVPYCHSKCAYCDFYSVPDSSTMSRYVGAVLQEALMRRDELHDEPLSTVYIGGGTPSSMGGRLLGDLINGLGGIFSFDRVIEMTTEVNPEDVDTDLLGSLRACGVNRVSMGVQSLVDKELVNVGRRHSASTALRASRLIADNFDNYNLDLIFGLPGQTIESLSYSLDRLIELRPPHLSVYLLSYEPGTRLYARLTAGKIIEADDYLVTRMYHLITERLGVAGYEHYEISNYALPSFHSRHNSAYWNSTPYLGLGPSAHSFDGLTRRFNPPGVRKYIEELSGRSLICEIDDETDENRFNDYIITRLRTSAGLELKSLERQSFGYLIPQMLPAMNALVATGQLIVDEGIVRIPSRLWLTADAVMRELIV